MNNSKSIAKFIYESLKKDDINITISLIYSQLEKEKTEKLKIIKTPLLNSIGKELGKLLVNEKWKFDRLYNLWQKGKRAERLIVISALGTISKKDYKNTKDFVLNIIDDISNWEICDQLALKVISKLILQNEKEIFSLMNLWIKSQRKWIKRLAIALIPPYIRSKPEKSRVCLNFLDKVMTEEDKDVKKAIAWALREISKKDSDAVFEFLKTWYKVENKNTKWIIKEGKKKLSKEQQELLKELK